MPITRKLVAVESNEENQILKLDHSKRFIVNDTNDWQFLFAQDASFLASSQVIKIAAKFNDTTLSDVQIVAYLYNPANGTVDSASTMSFRLYKVTTPDWVDEFITTVAGTELPNSYFYLNTPLTTFPGLDFEGGDTIMVEAEAVRLGRTYRDRVYINHLGVFDSILRLKNELDFLSITKKDL